MNKIKLPPTYRNFAAPHPTVVAGTFVNNKPTWTTLGDFGMLCANPMYVYIASVEHHYLNKGVRELKTFSVNIPTEKDLVETDYVGMVSGNKEDKSEVFPYFIGDLKTAPMIESFPVNLECEVTDIRLAGRNEVFMGKVTNIYCKEEVLGEKNINIDKVNPVILFMDSSYRSSGKTLGMSYSMGKDYKK